MRIYAVATHVRVWLCESRIDDPQVTTLSQNKRTVLMGRVWTPPSHLLLICIFMPKTVITTSGFSAPQLNEAIKRDPILRLAYY